MHPAYKTTARTPHAAHLLSAHLYTVLLGETVCFFLEPKDGPASPTPSHVILSLGAVLSFGVACGAHKGAGAAYLRYIRNWARSAGIMVTRERKEDVSTSTGITRNPVSAPTAGEVPLSRKRPRSGEKVQKETGSPLFGHHHIVTTDTEVGAFLAFLLLSNASTAAYTAWCLDFVSSLGLPLVQSSVVLAVLLSSIAMQLPAIMLSARNAVAVAEEVAENVREAAAVVRAVRAVWHFCDAGDPSSTPSCSSSMLLPRGWVARAELAARLLSRFERRDARSDNGGDNDNENDSTVSGTVNLPALSQEPKTHNQRPRFSIPSLVQVDSVAVAPVITHFHVPSSLDLLRGLHDIESVRSSVDAATAGPARVIREIAAACDDMLWRKDLEVAEEVGKAETVSESWQWVDRPVEGEK